MERITRVRDNPRVRVRGKMEGILSKSNLRLLVARKCTPAVVVAPEGALVRHVSERHTITNIWLVF